MLEAGYNLPKKAFFDNLGSILTYAVIGTLFNAFAIGLSLYGAYMAGLMPGIDDGHSQSLGVLESDIDFDFWVLSPHFRYQKSKVSPIWLDYLSSWSS